MRVFHQLLSCINFGFIYLYFCVIFLKTTLWGKMGLPLCPEDHTDMDLSSYTPPSFGCPCPLILICCTESNFLSLFLHFLSPYFLFSCPFSPCRPLTSDHRFGDENRKRLSLWLLHLLMAAPEVVKIMAEYWCSPEQGHEVMVYSVTGSWYYRQYIILALHLC